MHHIAQTPTVLVKKVTALKEDANMAIHGSSRGRGHVWLILLAVLGAALVSLLALAQWDSAARADEQEGRGHRITLGRSADPAFQHELSGAANRGDFEPKIVGGTPVADGKYPFMAYLEIVGADGKTYQCGGSLIDPDSVLTAAHCIVDVNARGVNLAVGRTVLSQNQGQIRFATTAKIHPRYNPKSSNAYDAAVLKLNRAVTGIKPIKPATASQDALETPGRLLTVAGWGTTSEGGNTSVRMREVSVPVVSDSTARQAYSRLPVPSAQYFPSLMVAAGAKGKDSCQGDSGGPLFNPGPTSTQVGIVSVGLGCARAGFPGVYTEANNAAIRTFILNAARS
jgi:secreted trypsin-like serine protease